MRACIIITAIALISGSGYGIAGDPQADNAGKEELKPQTVCPVMGGKINKDSFVDVKGKRIYLCCQGCEKAIKADPDKYIKKIQDSGEKPAELQTVCPVMGGKINKDSFVDVKGKRIYLCCQGCEKAIKADPDKYIKKMEDAGIVIEAAPTEDSKEKKK